jgi:hypothetical protein
VHFVTLLEEMPVQETLDGIHDLTETGIPIGAVIVNMERAPVLTDNELQDAAADRLDMQEIVRGVKAAGLEQDAEDIARVLAAEAADRAARTGLQEREKGRLSGVEQPRYSLPLLAEGMDLAGLYDLAEALREQGAA